MLNWLVCAITRQGIEGGPQDGKFSAKLFDMIAPIDRVVKDLLLSKSNSKKFGLRGYNLKGISIWIDVK